MHSSLSSLFKKGSMTNLKSSQNKLQEYRQTKQYKPQDLVSAARVLDLKIRDENLSCFNSVNRAQVAGLIL